MGSLNELIGNVEDYFEDSLINQEEYKKLDKLMGQIDYLFFKTINGLRQKLKENS